MAEKIPMGVGVVGLPENVFKRENRWTFQLLGFCNDESNRVPEFFCSSVDRPTLNFEEVPLHYLNGTTYLPGKLSWEPINVTYLDVVHSEVRSLWNWLATVGDFTDPINLRQGERIDWAATALLSMYDGCGTLLETWQLQNVFPTNVVWGELNYESGNVSKIQMTLRFSDAKYRSYCPDFVPQSCCSGCGNTKKSISRNYI